MREHAAEGPATEATDEAATVVALARGAPLTPAGVLGLQRQAGNRVTMALLQRETATAGATLRSGSKGNEVLRLQMHLNLLDEVKQELEVDSIYGPITTGAVKEFQGANSLKPTGVADPATLGAVAEAGLEDQDQEAIARKIFNLGGKAYERRKFGHAYGFFTRAYEMSGRPGVLFSRAQALRKLGGRRKEAIVLYEAYLATGHGVRDADAKAAIADLSTPARTGDDAADDATAKAIFMKGGAYYEAHDYAHAADEFDRAAEMSGRAGPVFSEAQALRRLGGRREDAIALYEQYLATGHGVRDADAKTALAELRTPDKTGDDAADEATAKAIFAKGGAYYEAGDYGHAADEFARAAELSGRAGPVFSEAQALRKLGGRTEDAISLYEQYLATGHGVRDADAQLMIELLTTHGAGPY